MDDIHSPGELLDAMTEWPWITWGLLALVLVALAQIGRQHSETLETTDDMRRRMQAWELAVFSSDEADPQRPHFRPTLLEDTK